MTTTWHVGVLGIMSLLIAGLVTLLPGVLLGAEDAAASRPADPPRVVVAGVVVDPAGKAAADASVTVYESRPFAPAQPVATTTTDAAGNFRIDMPRPRPDVYGQLVVARKPPLISQAYQLRPEWQDRRITLCQPMTVRGVVTNRLGRRVANARVWPSCDSGWSRWPSSRQAAHVFGDAAVSDERGRFTIEGFPSSQPIDLHVMAPGLADTVSRAQERTWFWGPAYPPEPPAEDPDHIRVHLRFEGRASGKVVDADSGRPVAGVTLCLGNKTAVSDAAGRFEFVGLGGITEPLFSPPMPATAPEWVQFGPAPQVVVTEGRETRDVEVKVVRPVVFEVCCRDRVTHQPIAPDWVTCYPCTPGNCYCEFVAGSDGRTFVSLAPGEWIINPNVPDYAWRQGPRIEVRRLDPPPKLVLDFVRASLPKPKHYELTVLDPTSQPVAGATVVRASGLVRTTTQTDERGRFVIEAGWNETVYPPSIVKDDLFLPATEWWTRVNNGGLERAAQHPIVLRPKSTVTLRVTDPDGQPIEGAIVNGSPWMRTPPPSDPLGISAVTDRSGRCLFRMMLVGSAFVWASKPGYVSGSVACVGGSRWTTLNASVVLTPLDGRVRGVVVDHEDRSVAGAWVMPSVPCPESATLKLNTVTDSAGRFTLPSTPRGPFVVSAGRRQGMLVLRGAGVASGGDEHVKLVLHPNTPYGGWVPQPVAGVPTATRPEEHPPGDPDAAIAEMIAELKKPGPGPSVYIWDLNVRVPELAESVRPIADRAVKALRALLQERPAEGFQPQYVLQLLDELDTPAARALLLDVALGVLPEKPIRDVRLVAAHRYALHSPDRDGLLRLLDVNDPSLIETALWQLGRWPIDEALFNRLSQLVHRQPPSERGLTEVFGLLGYDSDPRLLERKIDLAISVIDPTTTRPDAPAEPLPRHELYWRVHHPKNALIVMSGAGASLKARTAQLKGMARDVVLAARAERGDELVHDEIIEMLRDLRSPIRQYLAIRALPTIARRSDLAVINAVEDEIRSPQAAKELPENLGFWDLGQYIRRAAYMIDVRTPLDE